MLRIASQKLLLTAVENTIFGNEVAAALQVDAMTAGLDSVPLVQLNCALAPAADFLSAPLPLGQRGSG